MVNVDTDHRADASWEGWSESRFPLLLDSASVEEARTAAELDFIAGITTNPTLLSKEGRPALAQLGRLLAVFPGPIFYQPTTTDLASAEAELRAASLLAPSRVVSKLPVRLDFVTLATRLAKEGAPTALTAVYAPAQALLAAAGGIPWVIPYVNRASRLAEDGDNLVASLAKVLRESRSATRILAASIKSAAEAVKAVVDGARAVTAPLQVLLDLGSHPLTASAIQEFAEHSGSGDSIESTGPTLEDRSRGA